MLSVSSLATASVLGAPAFLSPASGVGATYRPYQYDPPGGAAPVYSRWNPCPAVPWKVNARLVGPTAPALHAAIVDVAGALARITQATGVQFRYAGQTTAVPTSGPLPSVAPLVIAWARPGSGAWRCCRAVRRAGGASPATSSPPTAGSTTGSPRGTRSWTPSRMRASVQASAPAPPGAPCSCTSSATRSVSATPTTPARSCSRRSCPAAARRTGSGTAGRSVASDVPAGACRADH